MKGPAWAIALSGPPGARMTMNLMAYCPAVGREGEREGLPPDWL